MRVERLISEVYVVGRIWQGITVCYTYPLNTFAIGAIRALVGLPGVKDMRAAIGDWLHHNAGDFQTVDDFSATISTPDGFDYDTEWETEKGWSTWEDCAIEDGE